MCINLQVICANYDTISLYMKMFQILLCPVRVHALLTANMTHSLRFSVLWSYDVDVAKLHATLIGFFALSVISFKMPPNKICWLFIARPSQFAIL